MVGVTVSREEGVARFAGLVPESALRAGANRLEIFEILHRPDGKLHLRRTRPLGNRGVGRQAGAGPVR